MVNKIILNCMPPAMVEGPSPAMSILKQFLENKKFEVDIFYWNHKLLELQSEFLWRPASSFTGNESESMMLFFNYLSIFEKDKKAYNRVKAHLMAIKPQYIGQDVQIFDKHMRYYAKELDDAIDKMLLELFSTDVLYYGMSVSLYQWVCASIVAKKIKQQQKEAVIIIGGIGTKEAAASYLNNFTQFDYAIWGEGEYPLLKISEIIRDGNTINKNLLINTAFSCSGRVELSSVRNIDYIPLDSESIRPNYSDYFEQKKDFPYMEKIKTSIPIEGSRGCHWRKCHFCYLNTGYRYRQKSPALIIDEIKYMINEFKPHSFSFLDNDVIGKDLKIFDELLDQLMIIKEDYPEFSIIIAEVITKGITANHIKKMALSGFNDVQIGYESPSNELLRKINKKNTFASNLLFIKYATVYGISVNGANVIRGLLEESDDDIHEGIANLYKLRFYFKSGQFKHNISSLGVMRSSPYYKYVKEKLPNWTASYFMRLLPDHFFKEKETLHDIVDFINNEQDPLWNKFQEIEKYYIQNAYDYKLFYKNDNTIVYKELCKSSELNELEFDMFSIEWLILDRANETVVSFDDLKIYLIKEKKLRLLDIEILNIIGNLEDQGLIYMSNNASEMVTIINTNTILS